MQGVVSLETLNMLYLLKQDCSLIELQKVENYKQCNDLESNYQLSSVTQTPRYLSYIDLLHQMCLFSAAAFLIKNCKDQAIGALSQQSTT